MRRAHSAEHLVAQAIAHEAVLHGRRASGVVVTSGPYPTAIGDVGFAVWAGGMCWQHPTAWGAAAQFVLFVGERQAMWAAWRDGGAPLPRPECDGYDGPQLFTICVALVRGLPLRAQLSGGRLVEAALAPDGLCVLELDGRQALAGDAADVGAAFYALTDWQLAGRLADQALQRQAPEVARAVSDFGCAW